MMTPHAIYKNTLVHRKLSICPNC